jgi:hypothetical protein
MEYRNNKLSFGGESQIEEVENKLKRKYGRGIYISGYTKSSDGALFVELGNTSPKDVSDCRKRDRVLKFIEYEGIYTLEAEPVEGGYLIELPDRKEVFRNFQDEKRKLARELDRTTARAIYRKLTGFSSVKNQLGAIESILRTVREEGPISSDTLHQVRGTSSEDKRKTEAYLRLLEDTDFVRIENKKERDSEKETKSEEIGKIGLMRSTNTVNPETERTIRSGKNLDAYDEKEIGTESFKELVLGNVVHEAFSTLKDELNITLLSHYPKYANLYYFTAIERGDSEVRLNVEAAKENLHSLYGEDEHEITVRQKLDDLVDVDVIEKEDNYYYSNENVYNSIVSQAPV